MSKRRLNDVTPEEWDEMYSLQHTARFLMQLQPVVPDKAAEADKMHIHHVSSVVNTDVDYNHLVEWNPTKKTLH